MTNLAMFINSLGSVDIVFFIVCGAIIALIVGIYFLIPVFNKKFYEEQRENLKKREDAYKSNAARKQSVNMSEAGGENVGGEIQKDEHNND